MTDKTIHTQTVSKDVAKASTVKLSQTTNTTIVFKPTLHGAGFNGQLIKYKKTSTKKWPDVDVSNFTSHTLNPMEKVVVSLDSEATALLLRELNSLQSIVDQGIKDGNTEYVVALADKAVIIDDKNKASILKQILEGNLTEDYWELLAQSQPDMATKLALGHVQQNRKNIVAELKQRLTKEYLETTGPDSWQAWIYKNSWLFGVNYQKPIEKQKINLPGIMPDYLFPRIDGFVDLLEIKLPKHEVIKPDTSHKGSYFWSSEASKAIGQVVNYLSEIERQPLEIEKQLKRTHDCHATILRPQAYILIGNSDEWSEEQHEGLRKLNHALHGVEVLTYQELIHRGEAFFVDVDQSQDLTSSEDEIPF